jgi:hypothetical protein
MNCVGKMIDTDYTDYTDYTDLENIKNYFQCSYLYLCNYTLNQRMV